MVVSGQFNCTKDTGSMPFLLSVLLSFQGYSHLFGVGSFSNYVTEVNGHRKDWALRASEFNKRANLMFTYAAALLIPLNWYKDEARKSDKNIDKNI